MLTEHNGLDSQSCSFDKPNLRVSITQESNISLIALAYALGVLCVTVSRACILTNCCTSVGWQTKTMFQRHEKSANGHEVPKENISGMFGQQIPYGLPWEQTRANDVRGRYHTTHITAALSPSVATSTWVMFVVLYDPFDNAVCNSDRQRRIMSSTLINEM